MGDYSRGEIRFVAEPAEYLVVREPWVLTPLHAELGRDGVVPELSDQVDERIEEHIVR